MRKVIVGAMVSMDGVMQAPGGPEEDPTGGFKFGGWTASLGNDPVFDEELGKLVGEPADDIAKNFNRITKPVATRKGVDRKWQGSVALRDAAKDVAKLKQEDGSVLVTQGSTELVHALLAAGLVDEIRTFTFPLLLGKGKRLFSGDSQPRAFKLTHSAVSPNGLIAATYVRNGEVKTGTIGGTLEPSATELARREK